MKRSLFVLLLSALCLIGCSEDIQPTMYTLTVTANPAEGGTINPAGGEFEEGTEVTIRVSPNTNYEFDKWSGNWNGVENPLTLTMDGNITLIGNFALSDSDNDGLNDDIDSCPNTPVGQTVDSNGCSSSQTDIDGDGVMDDIDTCSDTVEFEEVDENGCSDSQRDTDGDGVMDDMDTCSDTVEFEEVDENGCSDSQRDTDNDGVTDDIDNCPDTDEGINVDSDGCSRDNLLKGTSWSISKEVGALVVAENLERALGDMSGATFGGDENPHGAWWYFGYLDDDAVATYACLLDDTYEFNPDGTFVQTMGSETWLEPWQNGKENEGCGTPVAPHNGSNAAIWYSDNSTITIIGDGAFLGLSKVHNTAEDGNPVDDTITYNYELSEDRNKLTLYIQGFQGWSAETWVFRMVKNQ